ncbi:MAG: response regulator transcription factor [Deltaproteobacteria bacterium]|nr:response regulator transcription factor [Deltaproteobacteria bacterium]
MPKVLIADDHPIVRTGLKQIIADEPDINIIGEVSNGVEVLEFLMKNPCDLVLLDLAMPKRTGLDIISEIKQLQPHIGILVLSIYPEEQYAVRALRAGAAGYLTKASAPNELINAMHKVLSGGKYISASLAEILASEIDQHTPQHAHERLSDREYQVMLMLAAGKTVTEVAQELNLSVKTISTYRARILEKMNMKNNAQLTFYAVEKHLIE